MLDARIFLNSLQLLFPFSVYYSNDFSLSVLGVNSSPVALLYSKTDQLAGGQTAVNKTGLSTKWKKANPKKRSHSLGTHKMR